MLDTYTESHIDKQIADLGRQLERLYAGSGREIEVRPGANGGPGEVRISYTDRAPDGMGLDDRWAAAGAYAQMIQILYEEKRRLEG